MCPARDIWGQSRPSISQTNGPDIRRAIQELEDPSRPTYLFPARCELFMHNAFWCWLKMRKRRSASRRFI